MQVLTVITENRTQIIIRKIMQPHVLYLQFLMSNFTINGHIQFNLIIKVCSLIYNRILENYTE